MKTMFDTVSFLVFSTPPASYGTYSTPHTWSQISSEPAGRTRSFLWFAPGCSADSQFLPWMRSVMLQGESGQLFKLQMLCRYLAEDTRLSIHFLDFISTIFHYHSYKQRIRTWLIYAGAGLFLVPVQWVSWRMLMLHWGPPALWGWYIHSGWEGAKEMPTAGFWRIIHRGFCRNVSRKINCTDGKPWYIGRKSGKLVMRVMR